MRYCLHLNILSQEVFGQESFMAPAVPPDKFDFNVLDAAAVLRGNFQESDKELFLKNVIATPQQRALLTLSRPRSGSSLARGTHGWPAWIVASAVLLVRLGLRRFPLL